MTNKNENSHKKQYDKFAREFQNADEEFPDVTRPYIYRLIEIDKPGSKLLDVGCGYGKDLEHFIKQGYVAYGIDTSSEMIKLARERVPKAELTTGSFENIPYANDYFDIIFSRYAIQHSRNTEQVFREVERVLKPGCDFVFLVTHPIRHYLEKKTKDYWKKEEIDSVILNGKLKVCEPSHTLSEYLSQFLLTHFRLEAFYEMHDPAAQTFKEFGNYPRALIMKYRKN